jgi:GDPmannose 4,6-dehydratase
MKIAFITGINGQDGSYLTELLLDKNYIVYGMLRRCSNLNTQRIEHLINNPNLKLKYGDLSDKTSIKNIINKIEEENPVIDVLEIYNLGAMSHVQISFEMPEYCAVSDGMAALYLLEEIKNSQIKDKIRFYQAGTSEMYGRVLQIPQNENTPFNPLSPYASAKLYAYYITKNYRESYNIYACNGILFNHESPRRGFNFVTRKVTLGLSKILKDKDYILTLGNIYSKRDWGHAKDYVYAMWLMLQQDTPDDFVISTNDMCSVKDFIIKSFKLKDISIIWKGEGLDEKGYCSKTNRLLIEIDKRYYRPNEVELLYGDSRKAKTILGWKPKYNLDDLIKEMVESDCN